VGAGLADCGEACEMTEDELKKIETQAQENTPGDIPADALRFIVNARDYVPRLVAEVRGLRHAISLTLNAAPDNVTGQTREFLERVLGGKI
jgi:hypothetical protein